MITELLLGLTIIALFGILVWEKYENKKERAKWMNALIAKTPEQYRDLELTEKVKPIIPQKPSEPEFIPESDLTDEQFKDLLKEQNGKL